MQTGHTKSIVVLSVLWMLVLPVHAEIYKWVDKDGSVKYTDTPPPASAKSLSKIGKKAVAPTGLPPASEGEKTAIPAVNATNQPPRSDKKDVLSPEAEAKKKRDLEEVAKKNKAELEAQARKKELNCATAKTNYQTYSQGGRIYRTNEKGEREYVDEKGLAEGAAQAQRDMQEYCN